MSGPMPRRFRPRSIGRRYTLRTNLFVAIVLVVVLSIGLMLAVGSVLTRRAGAAATEELRNHRLLPVPRRPPDRRRGGDRTRRPRCVPARAPDRPARAAGGRRDSAPRRGAGPRAGPDRGRVRDRQPRPG